MISHSNIKAFIITNAKHYLAGRTRPSSSPPLLLGVSMLPEKINKED